MKRALLFVCALAGYALAYAYGFRTTIDGVTYNVDVTDEVNNLCEINGMTHNIDVTDIRIPGYVSDGYDNFKVDAVNIEASEEDGYYVYEMGNRSWEVVTVPGTIRDFKLWAWSVKEIILESGVQSIDIQCGYMDSFRGGGRDMYVNVPHVKEFWSESLDGCLTIGEEVKDIDDYAFEWLTVSDVIIKAPVKKLPEGCFYACQKLSKVTYPYSLEEIGKEAFAYTHFVHVIIPAYIKRVDERAFANILWDCDGYPQAVGNERYTRMHGLTSVSVYGRDTWIADDAFEDNLFLIKGAAKQESLFGDGAALDGMYGFIIKDDDHIDSDGVIYKRNGQNVGKHFYPADYSKPVAVEEGVTALLPQMVGGCRFIPSLTLPSTLQRIGADALNDCASLKTIVIPPGVTELDESWAGVLYDYNRSHVKIREDDEIDEWGRVYNSVPVYLVYGMNYLDEIIYPSTLSLGKFSSWYKKCATPYDPIGAVIEGDVVVSENGKVLKAFSGLAEDVMIPPSVEYLDPLCCNWSFGRYYSEGYDRWADGPATRGLRRLTLSPKLVEISSKLKDLGVIESISYPTATPLSGGLDSFSDAQYASIKLIVPAGTIDTFKATRPWNRFHSITEDPTLPIDPSADGFFVGNVQYTITVGGVARVIGCRGDMSGDFVIASEVTDTQGAEYTVCEIAADAFSGNANVLTVSLPPTIKDIEPGAFSGCVNLESVFYSCKSVQTDLRHHNTPVFANCPMLTDIIFEGSRGCIVLPPYIFEGVAVKKIDFGDKVSRVGSYCFANCSNLTEIDLGSEIIHVLDYAFANGPEAVVSVNHFLLDYIIGNVVDGGINAFANRPIRKIVLGKDAKKIESSCFCYLTPGEIVCWSLIPTEPTGSAFGCTDKSTCILTVPKASVDLYRAHWFWGKFANIRSTTEGMENIFAVDGVVYEIISPEEVKVVRWLANTLSDLNIPERVTGWDGQSYTVTEIEDKILQYNKYVRSVSIPAGMRTIPPYTFGGCENLESVDYNARNCIMTDNGYAIAYYASPIFSGCKKLTTFNFGPDVEVIPEHLCRTTKLSKVTVPDNVKVLKMSAFCCEFKELVLGRGITEIRGAILFHPDSELRVNCRNIEKYNSLLHEFKSDAESNREMRKITFGPEVETLCKNAFCECAPQVIECEGMYPPEPDDNVLRDTDRSACELRVPIGRWSAYKYHWF